MVGVWRGLRFHWHLRRILWWRRCGTHCLQLDGSLGSREWVSWVSWAEKYNLYLTMFTSYMGDQIGVLFIYMSCNLKYTIWCKFVWAMVFKYVAFHRPSFCRKRLQSRHILVLWNLLLWFQQTCSLSIRKSLQSNNFLGLNRWPVVANPLGHHPSEL